MDRYGDGLGTAVHRVHGLKGLAFGQKQKHKKKKVASSLAAVLALVIAICKR